MLSVAEKPAPAKKKAAKAPPKITPTPQGVASAAAWLKSQVDQSSNKISAPIVTLTPELAAAMLEHNPANRKIAATKVEDFVRDIKNGDWKLNGEPIIIASDGSLNDGQHRCQAVIQSGVSIQTVIIFGVGRDTRDTLDQGKNRMVGDYVAMRGHKNANHLAAAARYLWQWQTIGYVTGRLQLGSNANGKPTRTEIVHLIEATPGLTKSLNAVYQPKTARIGSIGMVAFCHFAMKVASNESAVTEFIQSLVEGADLDSDDPRLYCRNRLMAEKGTMGADQKVELIFRTWNAYRLNEKRSRIGLQGGELPMLES